MSETISYDENGHGALPSDLDVDLAGFECDDDAIVDAAPTVDAARLQALEDYARRREASRVNRKVAAGTTTSAVAGLIPAILVAVEGLNLPPEIEPFVLALAAALGAFAGGYFVRERPAPVGL